MGFSKLIDLLKHIFRERDVHTHSLANFCLNAHKNDHTVPVVRIGHLLIKKPAATYRGPLISPRTAYRLATMSTAPAMTCEVRARSLTDGSIPIKYKSAAPEAAHFV